MKQLRGWLQDGYGIEPYIVTLLFAIVMYFLVLGVVVFTFPNPP